MENFDHLAGPRGGTSLDDPSGARAAREAHDAGAVVAPLEVPTFDVHVELRVHAAERDARELVEALTEDLAQHPLVVAPVTVTLTERTL